jgi:hypothetical protein
MQAAMRQSVRKGSLLEYLVARQAWEPSLSIESEDGVAWQSLRTGFDAVYSGLDWQSRLPAIVDAVCGSVTRVDASVVAACVVRTMVQLVFRRDCTEEELAVLVAARDEFAKTLALRGAPDHALRHRAFTLVGAMVDGCAHLSCPPELSRREWVSVFFQPFLLSPAINVVDLFASIPELERVAPGARPLLLRLLDFQHPFPILERVLHADLDGGRRRGDALLLMLDEGERVARGNAAGLRFGAGRRACPGANLAIRLVSLLHDRLRRAGEFRPGTGHRYSGRTNDGRITVRESLYQGRRLASLLVLRPHDSRSWEEWARRYASDDRWRKYAWGAVRLLAVWWTLLDTGEWSWLLWCTGVLGAVVNTDLFLPWLHLAALAVVGVAHLRSPLLLPACSYLAKTMVGDSFAGKIDTREWKCVATVAIAAWFVLQLFQTSLHFLCLLAAHQFVVEYLDAVHEDWVAVRHRYFFELFYLGLVASCTLTDFERAVVNCDVVAAIGYRMGNALLIGVVTRAPGAHP